MFEKDQDRDQANLSVGLGLALLITTKYTRIFEISFSPMPKKFSHAHD